MELIAFKSSKHVKFALNIRFNEIAKLSNSRSKEALAHIRGDNPRAQPMLRIHVLEACIAITFRVIKNTNETNGSERHVYVCVQMAKIQKQKLHFTRHQNTLCVCVVMHIHSFRLG